MPADTIILDLSQLEKNTTNSSIYYQHFQNIKHSYPNHKFIFTDGSKTEYHTSYAITDEENCIKRGILMNFSSIFSAEIIAISEAINLIKKHKASSARTHCQHSKPSTTSTIGITTNHPYEIV